VYTNGLEYCLIEGDFSDDVPGWHLGPGENPALAFYVAAAMRADPDRHLTDLNGVYSGVYVNRDRSCVYVFGNLTGTRSVFWLADQCQFVVTGNLWAFRGCEGFARRWDAMALTEMLTIGFPMAGRTWLSGVRQLQRGRQVRAWADGRTDVRKLLKPIERQSWSFRHSVHLLRDSLDATVKRLAHRLDQPGALALSGGLDSRLLLASLHTQKLDHYSFTFCDAYNEREHRIAQSAAALLGEQHTTVMLDLAIADRLYRDLCLLNEGESQGFGPLFMAAHAQEVTNSL
jgi:asparagine synthetase B (glutamine-hydrolysing)